MRILNMLFGRLFAVVIMAVLAVVMAIITVFENMRINPPTPFPWYQSWWFYGLLGLFCLSILVVMLGRDQFRIRRWPSLAVHLGLVVVLLGGFLSWLGGTRGFLGITKGETATEFEGEAPMLVIERENLRRRVDLKDLADVEGALLEGPKGDTYEIARVLGSAKVGEDGGLVLDDSGRGRAAILVKSEDGKSETWLTQEGPAGELGLAKMRLTWKRPLGFSVTLIEAREEKYPASGTPKSFYSWIRIDDPDEMASREFLVETNAPLVYKGFRFYQSSMTANQASGFQVTRDPGLIYVTIGICVFFLGLIVLYARRFVSKPLRRREGSNGTTDELLPTPALAGSGAGEEVAS